METHLKNHFFELGKIIFSDLQNTKREEIKRLFDKNSENIECFNFWSSVNQFFKNNDASKPLNDTPVCHFVKNSPSVGRHRQHAYIKDLNENNFQIDALCHTSKLLYSNDELPLGALANALIKNDINAVDYWFFDFNNYANNKLLKSLNLLDSYLSTKSPNTSINHIKAFYSGFFFWSEWSNKKELKDYHYDGIIDFQKLLDLSKNIKEENINDFKNEIQNIIFNNSF